MVELCKLCKHASGYICQLPLCNETGRTFKNTIVKFLEPYCYQGYDVYRANYYKSLQTPKEM